jgi:hypothetical protein
VQSKGKIIGRRFAGVSGRMICKRNLSAHFEHAARSLPSTMLTGILFQKIDFD